MKLNEDKVPSTLDEAVAMLMIAMDDIEKDALRQLKDAVLLHHTIGRFIRNEWSLWQKDTILVQWFKKTYGIDHADDISGIILDCAIRDANKLPRRDKELAKKFIEHWKKSK